MKAFLLAAGNGTRLRPLTDGMPKCLLPVGDVPLLQIWLENCYAAGITEVLINVHAHAQKIRDFVARQATPVRVHIVQEEQLLGSAGTLQQNRGFVAGEKVFFVLYGDVLTNVNLSEMLEFHCRKNKAVTLGIYQVPDPSRCGIVSVDAENIVRAFVEKPSRPESNWAFSGVMIATSQLLDCVPRQCPVDLGFDVLPKLVGQMVAYPMREYVLDIGTLENYTAAQSSWPGLPVRRS